MECVVSIKSEHPLLFLRVLQKITIECRPDNREIILGIALAGGKDFVCEPIWEELRPNDERIIPTDLGKWLHEHCPWAFQSNGKNLSTLGAALRAGLKGIKFFALSQWLCDYNQRPLKPGYRWERGNISEEAYRIWCDSGEDELLAAMGEGKVSL